MSRSADRSVLRLFARYAILSLLPVLALGAVLALNFQREARQQGIDEGRAQAALVAHAAVEPLLEGHPLADGLSPAERAGLDRLVRYGMRQNGVLRMRLRTTAGLVMWSDDGSGFSDRPDDEALEAARGEIITDLTRLNVDQNDRGAVGPKAVEAYRPLYAANATSPVGVLELYLPYTPIEQHVTAGLHQLYRDLAVGLAMLWIAGFAISTTVSRGLRRQLRLNTRLAEHDVLTDLPNRASFRRFVADEVAGGRPVAVALVDLDRFKEVNDAVGHQNGDHMLVALAGRYGALLGPGDRLARLGGDEFGIVLRGVAGADDAIERLRPLVRQDVEVSGLPLSVEASIGVALAPEDGDDVDQLLQRADVAMYLAKAGHAGVVRYDPADDHYDARNLELLAEFRSGVEAGELVLHYQPKVSVSRGRVEAVEALVRWNHPVHGLLYPDAFVPLVEPTDLVDRLTEVVLATALRDMASLDAVTSVAVNVSARNLARDDFARRVVAVLGDAGVAPTRLIVEITETALLDDPARAAAVLRELHAAGVSISIDDFGQGQTSLGYLAALPVDELKIDKSFVSDMLTEPAHAAIVRSVVDLGHNLGLRVVAEGVETAPIHLALADYGCDVAQGYLFARPMPIADLLVWLGRGVAALRDA